LKDGDLVTVDICASFDGYCADMARNFLVGETSDLAKKMVDVAHRALEKGIKKACVGNRLSDISAAIQQEVEKHGFAVVRDFAGHGIGKQMHEDPEILNYGAPGKGPVLYEGMTFAIEPMITAGKYDVYIESDGWTVRTVDGSLAAHVEDTIAITSKGPIILTRKNSEQL
jgi:methionyl aminopeptidase